MLRSYEYAYILLEWPEFINRSSATFVIALNHTLYSINEGLDNMLVYEIEDV
jgi:hypothetical protein